jgi:PTH1 family peptidyl-tRNA hydrolase
MFYIVALGNPGEAYATTRHNIGWLVLDGVRRLRDWDEPRPARQFFGRHGRAEIAHTPVEYLYPDTFMNESGRAVAAFVSAGSLAQLIVIHDDVDLPLGAVKLSFGRGSGGQNGVQSIITTMGSNEFMRIRIGIAERSFWTGAPVRPTGEQLARFVLAPLKPKEVRALEATAVRVSMLLEAIITTGRAAAMNQFN